MTSVSRTYRIAEEIKRVISENLPAVNDPRMSKMASVTRVDLTRDLHFAKVYVSVYDDAEKQALTIAALNHAEGFMKRFVAKYVEIRTVPKLTFILDDSAEYSQKINKLLDEVKT